MRFLIQAPSNIALIKYMGKSAEGRNLPENASLSMTLKDLGTWVETWDRSSPGLFIDDEPPSGGPRGYWPLELNSSVRARIQKHYELCMAPAGPLDEVFKRFEISLRDSLGHVMRTRNTFPSGSGIASSASSFAAMTLSWALQKCGDLDRFEKLWQDSRPFRAALAGVSRLGSGSSCRSFLGPWVLWEGENVSRANFPLASLGQFCDIVLVISSSEKAIPSSVSHRLVRSSPLWNGRVERAEKRLALLLSSQGFNDVSGLVTAEMWDMHSLFHTSEKPFTYFEPQTLEVLKFVESLGFWVTMDAGPNVHVIVPSGEAKKVEEKLRNRFLGMKILADECGVGPSWSVL